MKKSKSENEILPNVVICFLILLLAMGMFLLNYNIYEIENNNKKFYSIITERIYNGTLCQHNHDAYDRVRDFISVKIDPKIKIENYSIPIGSKIICPSLPEEVYGSYIQINTKCLLTTP